MEDEITTWLRRRLGEPELIGDDAALLSAVAPIVTTDRQREGVHFPVGLNVATAARRALAVNLSDLAAMGARPRWALLALCAPQDDAARRYLEAFAAACESAQLRLAGGDLTRGRRLDAVVTLIGELEEGATPLRRSAAKPGDTLWLGGHVGRSAVGRIVLSRHTVPNGFDESWSPGAATAAGHAALLGACIHRHLAPVPQLALGSALATGPHRVAAIDLSDGISRDLVRLCRESNVGAVIEEEALRDVAFHELCSALELDPLDVQLHGGEDYVLLFALPPGVDPPTSPDSAEPCRKIGEVTSVDTGIRLRSPTGRDSSLTSRGWDHFDP